MNEQCFLTSLQSARQQIAEELFTDIPYIYRENYRARELYRTSILDPTDIHLNPLNMPSKADVKGSPFRDANFDLVKNYTLYLGLMSSAQQLSEDSRTEMDADWLRRFFEKHAKYLVQPYASEFGVSDRVIDELLSVTPSIRGGRVLFDPSLLTDIVLQHRTACAEEWLMVMRGVPDEHMQLERKLLEDKL